MNGLERKSFWACGYRIMRDLSSGCQLSRKYRPVGVKDIFIACVDGLSGFPEATNTVYPKTKVQLCIVHMMRNSLKYMSFKDRKEVAKGLKHIYSSVSAEEAKHELEAFSDKWDKKYPAISSSWRGRWENVIVLFDYRIT